jgi:hypothetical protein
MPWASTAISVGGSLLGGALGGSNKAAERAAKDAAARAQKAQEDARRQVQNQLRPYTESGENANRLLSQYLGTADPEGYARRPQLQDSVDELRRQHFLRFGSDYTRNSNMGGEAVAAKYLYEKALKEWEEGKNRYIEQNPQSQGDGRLLKDFTNEDFVKDPGYEFRLAEGEKGINRALSARGGYDSGSALKALARYNQDYGSTEFGNAYNRDAANKARIFSFLSGEKQTGLGAVGTGAGIAQNTANNVGNIGIQAAQQVGQLQSDRNMTYANAIQGAIGNLVYGMNRPRDSGVTSNNPWATPPFNGGYNNSAGNIWWNDKA